ncbi:MAG: LPS assembly protein LptD [Candidatus Omnitrophica bacterium]|nr:LPS assembly protein LptD [Candidatus Omnitrophota bacterium]
MKISTIRITAYPPLIFFLVLFSFIGIAEAGIFDDLPGGFSGETPQTEETQVARPISINADTVEYSTDSKNVTATGNVEVDYKGTKLSCQKLTVNTDTKDGLAEGKVKLEDAQGVIEAEKMNYNFQTKAGIMFDVNFRANPYFGKVEKMHKISESEFIGSKTQMSTCSFDHPHYRIKSRKVDFITGDKMVASDNLFTVGQKMQVPILALPKFSRSLKKPYMHVQFMPGHRRDWGYYLLTAWRYNLTENVTGDILFDYRELFGVSEGFTLNYKSANFGRGDFKYYYTQERDKSKDLSSDVNVPKVFQRYMMRWRHQWDITKDTNLISEFYKIVDSKRMIHGSTYNFLKDYFYREYEKDAAPLTYVQVRQLLLGNSSLNVLIQPRVNSWYTQLEKLPELSYSLPNTQIVQTPFYWENSTAFVNYASRHGNDGTNTGKASDIDMSRFDIINKMSMPMKVAFVKLTPFVQNEATYYNADINSKSIAPRIIFSAGSEVSTKFFRIFNIKSNFLGMDINGIRHVITPTINYDFQNTPTIPRSRLRQIDAVDAMNGVLNEAVFELSNKLQTKRKGQSVDLVDFRIHSSYYFRSSSNKPGGSLSDFLIYLDILPYSWMSFRSDATFSRDGNHFTQINADLAFNFGTERTISIGNRYTRESSKETILQAEWRIHPKWKVKLYERMQFGRGPNLGKGLREQEYTITRNMHCWDTELSWNSKKAQGESVWIIFRLKAFPELEFNINQSYNTPEPGSQSPGSPTN